MDTANSTNISDSLLGNLQTKIFHANACPHTNEYAERLFGQELQATGGMSVGAGGVTGSITRTMLPNLPAVKFTTPKKGGEQKKKLSKAMYSKLENNGKETTQNTTRIGCWSHLCKNSGQDNSN